MVDISSGDKKINITVSTSGNKASVNATPDTAMYYSNKSREWAISDKIVENTDYSSKYYANVSKQNADKSTVNLENLTTNYNQYKNELENTKDISVEEIETAKTNAISDITNQENLSVDNVNTAGETQVNLAREQATIATTQAGIATAKTSEVVESGNNAITVITEQETTSKNNIETKGAEQIELIQNEGTIQIANVQSTGFYMRDDKLYFINSQGEEEEFKSGGSGLEVCDIGMALYIDETKGLRRYLNGQIVDINTNTQAFSNRLKEIQTTNPDYFTDEETWQTEATLNIDGCVYKFVLNYAGDTVVSVRLPKYPDYVEINAGGTLPVVGNGMTLGLTDGTRNYGLVGVTAVAARLVANSNIYGLNVGSADRDGTVATTAVGVTIDPTKSGIQTTLKQTKLKMRYFIQIATGAETENNIINEIELNNPFSLFDSKYSDHELNNLSWLKSEGQWNAKAVYPTAYDKLLKVYNGTETVEGLSVKLSTEDYTDYDFVLNTADETFRLPLKTKLASGKAVAGNGYSLGLTDGTNFAEMRSTNYNGTNGQNVLGVYSTTGSSQAVGTVQSGTSNLINDAIVGVTTDPTKSGIETSDSGLYLYYYVGETVQNANLIDAGRIGEQLATKTDIEQASRACAPSNKYIDLTAGASGSTYTAPASGYFAINVTWGAQTAWVGLSNGRTVGYAQTGAKGASNGLTYVYCAKGDVINLEYYSITVNWFSFIYAKGEV